VPPPLVLYSATSLLAYTIGQKYYQEVHYVWCAPLSGSDRYGVANPPSSDPLAICWRFFDDIKGGDQHSALVEANRRGLIRGASVKEGQGVIDQQTREVIELVVKSAALTDFSPLLLVIPFASVSTIVKPADILARARVTSEEYIIENLPRNCFDVLEVHR
jgi:hypothetical protein